jgi:hypothetical protein
LYFGKAEMCGASEFSEALFTSYVLLCKTQSSVTAGGGASPFQKGLYGGFFLQSPCAPGHFVVE